MAHGPFRQLKLNHSKTALIFFFTSITPDTENIRMHVSVGYPPTRSERLHMKCSNYFEHNILYAVSITDIFIAGLTSDPQQTAYLGQYFLTAPGVEWSGMCCMRYGVGGALTVKM